MEHLIAASLMSVTRAGHVAFCTALAQDLASLIRDVAKAEAWKGPPEQSPLYQGIMLKAGDLAACLCAKRYKAPLENCETGTDILKGDTLLGICKEICAKSTPENSPLPPRQVLRDC